MTVENDVISLAFDSGVKPAQGSQAIPAAKPARSMLLHMAWTALTSVGVLAVNFMTGWMVVLLLGDEGRGKIAAIGTWAQIGGWAAGMGFYEAITYMRARNVHDPRRLFGSSLLVIAVFGTIGVIIAESLISRGFKAQSSDVIMLARVWMLTIYLAVAGSMFNGLITGNHEFGLLNSMRFLQPLVYLIGLVILWMTHHFSVVAVMATNTGVELVLTSYLFVRLLRTVGLGKPSWVIIKEGVAYGVRVQGAVFAALANGRLDLMLMPRLLTAGPIGLYSIATNLSGNVVSLLGSCALVVFPSATRADKTAGMALVTRSLRFIFWSGFIGSAIFFAVCPFLLHLVYRGRADGAVVALRLLLPGVVALAAMRMVDSGLQSVNKPQQASYAQLVGLVVTLVGLYLTLGPLGIRGAALTSTLSYIATFTAALWFLAKEPGFSVSKAFSPVLFYEDLHLVSAKLLKRKSAAAPAAAAVQIA